MSADTMEALSKINAVGGAAYDALMTANSMVLFLKGFDDPTKAQLLCGEMDAWNMEVQFNPTKFDITRAVSWSEAGEALSPWGTLIYSKGSPDQLSFELLFDQSVYRTEGAGFLAEALASLNPVGAINGLLMSDNDESVLDQIAELYRLTMPIKVKTGNAGGFMRPPLVTFLWEKFQFVGIIENVQFSVVLFDDKGKPKRATANVTMKGRAMYPETDPEKFFSPLFVPEAASDETGALDLDPLADARLSILDQL